MAKKIHFDTERGIEYKIIGIASHSKDFRLAYHLNKTLFLDLKKKADLKADIGLTDSSCFSFYTFEERENFISFYLVSNKNSEGTLIPELKQADYFLLVKGPFSKESMERFLKTIKGINNVQTSFKIEIGGHKKITQLFTEIEIHSIAITGLLGIH